MYHVAHDMLLISALHVICKQLHPGHYSIHVADSLRRSEEIVKELELRISI